MGARIPWTTEYRSPKAGVTTGAIGGPRTPRATARRAEPVPKTFTEMALERAVHELRELRGFLGELVESLAVEDEEERCSDQ